MGCAGSNPLPADDAMVGSASSGGRAVTVDAPPMSDAADKACSMVQKVVDSVNIDDVVKKIQGIYMYYTRVRVACIGCIRGEGCYEGVSSLGPWFFFSIM